MWELYAMWSLIALFFIEYFQGHGTPELGALTLASLMAFFSLGTGALGAVLAGMAADRIGRERTTIWAMALSGSCALVMGWLTSAPPGIVVALAVIWGFAIVADSAQFSAVVTEVAPPHAVGTALTLQTSVGFALTAVSIWLAVEVSRRFGWGPAFSLLAVGPALGIVPMLRLQRLRRSRPAGELPRGDLQAGATAAD